VDYFVDTGLAVKGKIVWNAIMSEVKKYEITVKVHTTYLPEQSDEALDRYVFAYTIVLSNAGTVPAQLISRHWIISDGSGGVQEVRGLGVVGEQPLLKPGDSFEYTSGTAISTPVGSMKGSYQMVAEDGLRFDAAIPEFILSVPRILH
jgi:ApaG protein